MFRLAFFLLFLFRVILVLSFFLLLLRGIGPVFLILLSCNLLSAAVKDSEDEDTTSQANALIQLLKLEVAVSLSFFWSSYTSVDFACNGNIFCGELTMARELVIEECLFTELGTEFCNLSHRFVLPVEVNVAHVVGQKEVLFGDSYG